MRAWNRDRLRKDGSERRDPSTRRLANDGLDAPASNAACLQEWSEMTSFDDLLRETTCALEPLAVNYLSKVRDDNSAAVEQPQPSTSDAYAKVAPLFPSRPAFERFSTSSAA